MVLQDDVGDDKDSEHDDDGDRNGAQPGDVDERVVTQRAEGLGSRRVTGEDRLAFRHQQHGPAQDDQHR